MNIALVELVLAEVFDYFIDVFNQNIEPLPTIQKDITIKLREMTQQGKMYERAQFLNDLKYENDYMFDGTTTAKTSPSNSPEASPSLAKIDPENYTVIIYNDEYHNYSQATTALRQGVPDNVHIDLLTSRIDGEGRAMLKCSQDLSSVLGGFCCSNEWIKCHFNIVVRISSSRNMQVYHPLDYTLFKHTKLLLPNYF